MTRWWQSIDAWSWIATALILLGILAEIGLLFVFPHWQSRCELIASVAADVFIGAGLIIELICIRKGMVEKLQSEQRLTEALHRAVRAENSLIELRTPRRSLMTQENREALIRRLRPFAGTEFDVGVSGLDTEIVDCLWDIEETLLAAEWHQIPWTATNPNVLRISRNLRPECGLVSAESVTLEIEASHRDGLLPAANALVDALNAIGIAARERPILTPVGNVAVIHLYVGSKL